MENNYLFYTDFLNNDNILDKKILVSKTKNSFLIGPIINDDFDKNTFCRRVLSSSLYSKRMYKKANNKLCNKMINKYSNQLKDNEVIEIFNNGNLVIHKIILVPRG